MSITRGKSCGWNFLIMFIQVHLHRSSVKSTIPLCCAKVFFHFLWCFTASRSSKSVLQVSGGCQNFLCPLQRIRYQHLEMHFFMERNSQSRFVGNIQLDTVLFCKLRGIGSAYEKLITLDFKMIFYCEHSRTID